jgi:ABC-type antimicrobial peptide transport system permease subunit
MADHPLLPLVDEVRQDLRYALRGLRHSPGFTATVILTVALGIGANVAMFNVVDRLFETSPALGRFFGADEDVIPRGADVAVLSYTVVFGVLAVAVATVGLYGAIGYTVVQRSHELSVRVALGARQSSILRLVMGQSARVALVGTAIGMAVAVLASRWIQPLLFRQSATDPPVYGVIGTMMILVALAASAAPALRATQADPNTALRAE